MTRPCLCSSSIEDSDLLCSDKVLQRQLAHAQRMEDIHILTGGICHHFNNQLATILGYLELTKQMAESDCHNTTLGYLDKMEIAANQMKTLVAQLRRFCSVQAKQTQPLCIVHLLRETESLIRASVDEKVELLFELENEPESDCLDLKSDCLIVKNEAVQLQQMLMILINNAVKAIDGKVKGVLRIGVSKVQIQDAICDGCHQHFCGTFAEVWVSDNGVGIEDKHRAKLFMPFFTTRQMDGGTGMGLSVVHAMLHEQSAHVLVHSEPGVGSCFKLLLPIIEWTEAKGSMNTNKLSISTQGTKVVVVDGEPAMTELLSELLTEIGVTVSTFSETDRLLAKLYRQGVDFDVLMIERRLCSNAGHQLLETLKAAAPQLPIVAIGGESDLPETTFPYSAVLTKPFKIKQLKKVLSEALNHSVLEECVS